MISQSQSPGLKAAWVQAATDCVQSGCPGLALHRAALYLTALVLLPFFGNGQGTELSFTDFNNQGSFNSFSGDDGTFASKGAGIKVSFDNRVFRGANGASLRVDYAVPSGFCGLWHSLVGKASFPQYSLNFTNLYGSLRNSAGNPSRVENVRITQFSFWARGDGDGDFEHNVKLEFKSPQQLIGTAVFSIPNRTNWIRCDFPTSAMGTNDLSRVKEVIFVIEDWRNHNRTGRLYLDDATFTTDEVTYDPASWGDDAMLDLVAQRAFHYFLTFTDDLGFALDRSTYSDIVSVGTIGFQLAAYCIGHRRGWSDPAALEQRVATILQNLKDIPMGPEMGTTRAGYRGFYYHFLAANAGVRKDEHVELSLYDTMLLMYGVLTCKEYFTTNSQIQTLSQQLFDRVEWNWLVDLSPGTNANRFYLGWTPGPTAQGTFFKHVDGQTDEAMMVDILALGSRTYPTTFESYAARNRVSGSYPPASRKQIMVSWQGSLFNYFFASCWLNFQDRGLDLHPGSPRDIWQNDKLAILANRRFCLDHARTGRGSLKNHYATYAGTAWGITACDNLVPPATGLPSEYFSFGALPSEENIRFGTKANQVGTIAIYGAVSSINFVREAALEALRGYFAIPNLWSPLFGFGDAFSLDPHYFSSPYDAQGNPAIHAADYLNGPWINHMVMGINVGPMLLAIENFRNRQIWELTARNPEIVAGLNGIFGVGPPRGTTIAMAHHSDEHSVRLRWQPEPGASEYYIYTSTNLENWSLRQAGIKGTTWMEEGIPRTAQRFYQVKAVR
jgi:hypothetical protein